MDQRQVPVDLTKYATCLIIIKPEGEVFTRRVGTFIPFSYRPKKETPMRIRVTKNEDGTFTVSARRTRSWEQRQLGERDIPREQIGDAVGQLVKKVRDDHRPARPSHDIV
jgi:hypothetical protein